MPPQKKGIKEQTKQAQKITKQLENLQQFMTQELDTSDEDDKEDFGKRKVEITSNQRKTTKVAPKEDAPLRQLNTTKTRGQQAAAAASVAASITPSKIVTQKKNDGKIEPQPTNGDRKNNGKTTPISSTVNSKKEANQISIIPHSSRFISKNMTNKPAENKSKKNLIDLSSQEEDIVNLTFDRNGQLKKSKQIDLDDIPLRQVKKTGIVEQTKPSQLAKQPGIPLRQQNPASTVIKLQKTTPLKGKINETEEPKKSVYNNNTVNHSEFKKSDSLHAEKKQLTANELQAMSKLLSIQADGLKIKQQQHQQQQHQQIMQNQQQYSRQQQYKPNNAFGEQPVKKLRTDYSSSSPYGLMQNQIIIGDNDTDTPDIEDIDDSLYDSRDAEEEGLITSCNIFPIDQQRLVQCGTPIGHGHGNITPQSKSLSLLQHQKTQQMQQQMACSYLQSLSSLGPQPPRPILGKVTPNQGKSTPILITGKTTPIMQMNLGSNKPSTPLRSFTGKTTPMNKQAQEQPQMNNWNGKVTPVNGKIIQIDGKSTPLNRINSSYLNPQQMQLQQQLLQQQQQQHTLIDIESEIQSRIESIKNEIGPLLACLNSDLIVGNTPQTNQTSRPQAQQTSNQLQQFGMRTPPPVPLMSESRIYQDMRDRRLHAYEDRNSTPISNNTAATPSANSSNIRGYTPNIQPNRNSTPNMSQIHRNVTPTRMPVQTRIGDWVCANCKNLNFSYRAACNRCCLSQADNDIMIRNTNNNENTFLSSCNNQLKKTPIRTVEDVKRTFQDTLQNKENMNISNFTNNVTFADVHKTMGNQSTNRFQHGQDSSMLMENNNTNNGQQTRQTTSTYGQNKGKRSTLSYKQLQEMGFENDPVLKISHPEENLNINNKTPQITIVDDTQSNFNKKSTSSLGSNIAQTIQKEITSANTGNGLMTHKIVFIDNSSAAPIVEISNTEQNQEEQEANQQQKEAKKRAVVDPRVQLR